jgi:uncharacterized protein (DUF2141 family)
MKNRRFIQLISLVILFVTASCAKQTAPTGGPKDTIPPILVESFPKNNDINYKGDHLEMTFDEFINLDNPKEKILITPDIEKKFQIIARKKKVVLTFEEPLKDTVTYSINFQESIKDITEKNPAENLKIAFSTGGYIDSLEIKGKAQDPLTGKEVKNATVALYQSDTFSIFNHRPSYISRTNEKGSYTITNLKHGTYFLYAFNDANRNLIVDSKSEGYAFQPIAIRLNKNAEADILNFIKLDAREIKLTSARPYNTYFNIKFSKGIKNYRIRSATGEVLQSIIGEDKSSIKVYKTFEADSLPIALSAQDSIGHKLDTTMYVKFSPKKSTPESFDIALKNWKILRDKGRIEGTITYNKPFSQINFDSIFFRIDSINFIRFSQENIKFDSIRKELAFSKTFDRKLFQTKSTMSGQKTAPDLTREGQKPALAPGQKQQKSAPSAPENLLYLGSAAFISVEADTSKSISETLRPLTSEETGVIRVNIQTPQPFIIVQLLDKAFTVISTVRNNTSITFDDLRPGDYQVRLIIDQDNNGEWTPGNPFNDQETEPILFYINEKKNPVINLKANWELGPLLISY